MNDPNKAIDVNLSSLLSLKAELLRKQAEVSRAKASRAPADDYRRSISSSEGREKKCVEKKQRAKEVNLQGNATVYEHEDSALLEKSQRVLEAKSKFYERMSRNGGKLNSDDNCLVLFNRKQQDSKIIEPTCDERISNRSTSESSSSDDEDEVTTEEDDWVEYTDCLGRTRKCLRRDLSAAMRRDKDLAASMPERLLDQSKPNWMLDTKATREDSNDEEALIGPLPPVSVYSDGCSLMSKHDEQRVNWERKEQENLEKSDVHYQDVFFDEARQHGVGYYAFSTDEEERKRQHLELERARQQTISEQKHRDEMRAKREEIIAMRVLAAKNRQRARIGLPPLEKSEIVQTELQETISLTPQNESKEERKVRKRAEKLKRKQQKAEEQRELERQQHIRPWDEEKKGVASSNISSKSEFEPAEAAGAWSYKPDSVPLSQDEWNERKRAERKEEFAPSVERPQPLPKRTHFSSMPPPAPPLEIFTKMPPPPVPQFNSKPSDDNFASFQSSKREKQFHRRNYANDVELQSDDASSNYRASGLGGAAIPPPSNLDADFMLPPHSKKSKSNVELERSIEAGLRFLRNNSDKGTMSTKSSWTAKADY